MRTFVCRDCWGYVVETVVSESAPTAAELEAKGIDPEHCVFREENKGDWCSCGDMDCHARTHNGGGKCAVKIALDEPQVHFDKFGAIQYLMDHDESCNEWHEAGMWSAVKCIMLSPDDNQWDEADLKCLLNNAARY